MTNPPLTTENPGAILARMEEELTQMGAAATKQWTDIRAQAARMPEHNYAHIVLTGCGDSFYAGMAMRVALESLSGLPITVVPAMEAATFPGRILNKDSLLVAVSVSGKVERTIEAVSRHRQRGGDALAVTALSESDLGRGANFAIATGMRGTPGPVPGTANYLGSLLALASIGLELQARSGRPATVTNNDVHDVLREIDPHLVMSKQKHGAIVRQLEPPFFVLGSGPDLGAATFGVAKFLEAAAVVGVAQDLEEWAHEQYFATRDGTTVLVVSSTPATHERAERVARSAAAVGALPVTIGFRSDAEGAIHIPLPQTPNLLAPLVAWVSLALLALTYARTWNRSPFGIDRPNRMKTVDNDIYV